MKKQKIPTPVHKILIEPDPVSKITPGGIILPDTFKRKEHKGTALAVPKTAKSLLKEGDRVLYNKHDAEDLTIEGWTFHVLQLDQVTILPE
jgi:co-chaperonin GroES (HSP10)